MKLSLLLLCATTVFAQEKADLKVVNRIRAEAFQNSKVMDSAAYLTDVFGARLTGSPALKKSADWVVGRLKEWGFDKARL